MKFLTFQRGAEYAEAGVLVQDNVISLASAGFPDLISVLAGGPKAKAKIENWVYEPAADAKIPLSDVKILAPIPRPPKFICVGLNYRDHAIESNMAIPKVPTIFSKFSNAVISPGDNIVLPKNSTQPDYEAEFAFVIGKGGRHIAAENWKEHVFGYTIVNDVSARDVQLATSQWLMGKTFDTFAPMGPYVVSADEIPDPHNLNIGLRIHDEVLQNSNTRELIFKIPELVAFLSSVFTFEPGDIVSTGTPAGVGFARKPPRLLKPGDECVVTIEGLGELRNPVVAEA
ncbi:MAG: fumarylacetoacetate hydrolase family protein [Acidobacteriaceae bacterium]|nr:fumarylacetoacetate hydrolase family protein [Acidobacteriaceae bacterium]